MCCQKLFNCHRVAIFFCCSISGIKRCLLSMLLSLKKVYGSSSSCPQSSTFTTKEVVRWWCQLKRLKVKYSPHSTVLFYSQPQWKETLLLPSFLTYSSGTTTMTFSGASLPVEWYSTVWWIFNLLV